MLAVSDLAQVIHDAVAALDRDGNPIPISAVMNSYAQSIINTLKAGLITHTPGTVTGSAPPGGALSNGAAVGGLVSNLLPATWTAPLQATIPNADPSQISSNASGSTAYLMASSLVNFAANKIQGVSTASPVSPGILANGAGTDGKITAISGAPWGSAVLPAGGDPTFTQNLYNAISTYIMNNAVCGYASGKVVGSFSAGDGSLTAGAGTLGTIK